MRSLVGLFGLVGGAIIVWNVSKYGFQLSDNDADGYMWGAIYGGVTLVGLGGFAFASHLARRMHNGVAWIIRAISFAALLISLTNAHSAMTGRTNGVQAARLKVAEAVRIANRTLNSDQKELDALKDLKLEPATWAEVEAAQAKAKTAKEAKDAVCDVPDRTSCINKRKDETKALEEVAAVSKRRATAERIKELEADIKTQNKVLRDNGPVLEGNITGISLVRIFGLPDSAADRASAIQNLLMALLWEIAVAVCLWSYEILAPVTQIGSVPNPVTQPVRLSRTRAPKSEPKSIEQSIEMQPDVVALPAPEPRKAIASKRGVISSDTSHIAQWYKQRVMKRSGERIRADIFRKSYEAWCADENVEPVSLRAFGEWMTSEIGEDAKEKRSNRVYYHGIRLKLAEIRAVG